MLSKWYILGAGAIGSLIATQLKKLGQEVILLLKDEALCNILQQEGGIKVTQNNVTQAVSLAAEPLNQLAPKIDRLIVTTKAYDAIPALKALKARLHENTQIILLQNGMGVVEQLQQQFPAWQIYNAVTSMAAYRKQRFHIQVVTTGPIWMGSYNNKNKPAWFDELQKTYQEIMWESAIEQRLWEKLAVNCAINPLTALLNCRNGRLLLSKKAKHIMQHICQEVELLLQVKKISLNRELLALIYSTAEATKNNFSSMQQDLKYDRLTEIDYINGYVLNESIKYGLHLPYNQLIYDLITAKQEVA